MKNRFLFCVIITVALAGFALADFNDLSFSSAKNTYSDQTVKINIIPQRKVISPDSDSAIMFEFITQPGWHFYAENKPDPTGKLAIKPSADGVIFADPIFPLPEPYKDEFFGEYGIYENKFNVHIPFKLEDSSKDKKQIIIKAGISGAACKDICIKINAAISETITLDPAAAQTEAAFELPKTAPPEKDKKPAPMAAQKHSTVTYFALAIFAGLMLNIMPCVWPMIPIIITRLLKLSGNSRAKNTAEGLEFGLGILLFFAAIAVLNIVLRLGFGIVFQLGDHFRHPAFVTAMSMLMVAMGLFMFGVFNFNLPPSVINRASQGEQRSGSVGMGFLLALLSTPCSFGILAAAFAWAQTQPLPMATFTIMLIGVGMAIPYLLLTSIPGLLDRMPKAGGWMEHVKQMMGFVLLVIAIKLISALPEAVRINTVYFALVLSFAVWMWGSWVTFSTTRARKYLIRIIAIILTVAGGWLFLGQSQKLIDWKDYDPVKIAADIEMEKPVLIEFTADWCTTCTFVDKLVYSKKEVADLIKQKGLATYKGDTTGQGQATTDLAEIYKEPGVPVSVLHLPDGKIIKLRGMNIKQDLVDHLNTLNNTKDFDGKKDSQKGSEKEKTEEEI